MEGLKHAGVVIATVSNVDAAQAEVWEQRWRSGRVPDAVENGAVDHGIGFRVSSGYDLGGATHFAIYETQSDDVAAAARRDPGVLERCAAVADDARRPAQRAAAVAALDLEAPLCGCGPVTLGVAIRVHASLRRIKAEVLPAT